jgi:DNA end-binding protein Ku
MASAARKKEKQKDLHGNQSAQTSSSKPGFGRPIWQGSISFGLVNIPIALYSATRRDELKFRLLRKRDLSPIHYKRVAEADGKEVPWDEVVKGYEYEKDRFVVMEESDFEKADVEATKAVDITDFVDLQEINPMYFSRPYYMHPNKGGEKAFALLRDALKVSRKVGIAKVVIKARQYLAAVKPVDKHLTLEILHFSDELIEPDEIAEPPRQTPASKGELEMATTLIDRMTGKWEPEKYKDEYKTALMERIEEKVKKGGRQVPAKGRSPSPTNVIDLAKALKESLEKAGKSKQISQSGKKPAAKKTMKKAA